MHSPSQPAGRAAPSRRGFTLIEIALSLAILACVISMFTTTIVAMLRQREVNRQNSLASRAIQSTLERIRNEPLSLVWALYDPEAADDPLGPGMAPGPTFDVAGLPRISLSPELPVGLVLLPGLDAAEPDEAPAWQLREDLEAPELGMPRDLDLDHVIDQLDHAGDCRLLPVEAAGARSHQAHATAAEYSGIPRIRLNGNVIPNASAT